MKTTLQFASATQIEQARRLFPVTKPPTKPTYNDLVFNPEYQSRKFTFAKGQTCIRILPQLAAAESWMLGIYVLTHPNGQHLHPRSLTPKAKSVFDTAYGWLRTNKPETLYSKSNPKGFRLLPSAMNICWVLVDIDGEMKAKLFIGSAYDGGSQGVNCGVGNQLFRVASEINKSGGHDAAHSEHGVQIIVEKATPYGAKYPNYKMTRASVETPISRYLERMDETEIEAIRPLHEVLRRVDSEQEWEMVAKVIGEELRNEIRNSTAKPQSPSLVTPELVSLATDEPSPVSEELPFVNDAPSNTSDDEWH